MKKIDFGSNEEFIAIYEKLKSATKVGEYYGCSKSPVLKHAKDIGYDTSSNKTYKLSPEDKQAIIEAYSSDLTSADLAEKYNVSRGMITKIWYDANLSGKTKTSKESKDNSLVGQKINLLTVIEQTENRNTAGSIMWKCQCECGNFIEVASSRLRNGMAKSCGCLSKAALEKGRGANFNDLTNQIFGELTVLERCEDKITTGGRAMVQWKCKCSCGEEVKVLSTNLITGNSQSCGLCKNISHGNNKIAELLKINNIPYEQEKRFNSCKDKGYLPFDFFVDNKYLIEFDGIQHFEKIDGAYFDFEKICLHDKIKNGWAKENQIPLIRIPYTIYNTLAIEDLKLETSNYII